MKLSSDRLLRVQEATSNHNAYLSYSLTIENPEKLQEIRDSDWCLFERVRENNSSKCLIGYVVSFDL